MVLFTKYATITMLSFIKIISFKNISLITSFIIITKTVCIIMFSALLRSAYI